MTTTPTPSTTETTLAPSYTLPIGLLLIGFAAVWLQPWIGGAIVLFSTFLLWQTATLRLVFTATALDIFRGESLIRQFPYQDWQNWRIFWSGLPILFYFREVKSIHFLPMLFNSQALKASLESRQLPRV